jgi:hypothetical protein
MTKVLRKLGSAGRTRAEIIAGHAYAAALPPPPVPDDAPKPPVDEEGNVDGAHKCARADCQHLASAHDNTDLGLNTGPCSACSCMEMKVSSEAEEEEGEEEKPGDEEDGDSPGTPNERAAAQLAVQPADAPPAADDGGDAEPDPDLNAPPEVEAGEKVGPEFAGVLVIEGQPTGDGREIAPDALTWRVPPLPLMGLKTETHDPSGFDMNDPAVICGLIHTLTRVPGENGSQLIQFGGNFFANDDGLYFADLVELMGRMGISADIAVQDSEITVEEVDETGYPMDMSEVLTEGTILGGTQVPFPAFQGCYIVLGDGTEAPEAREIPQAAEAPVVPARPPAVVAAGGQLLHLMAASECEACDQGVEVIVASGGPTRPPAEWFEDPQFVSGDGRLVEILGRDGRREPGGKFACPLTVTAEGRVFGHIAPWNVCHTGKPGQCVVAPKSSVEYAHFKRGRLVTTAEGEQVRCGTITADTGHAPLRISASTAMAHYDNTALQAADVNVGHDEHGIWVAGALRPGVTEQQVRNLETESVSGDWREIGGRLELVAALAVPLPGFPIVVVDHEYGERRSITAAGAFIMHRLKHPVVAQASDMATLTAAVAPLLPLAKQAARESIDALR